MVIAKFAEMKWKLFFYIISYCLFLGKCNMSQDQFALLMRTAIRSGTMIYRKKHDTETLTRPIEIVTPNYCCSFPIVSVEKLEELDRIIKYNKSVYEKVVRLWTFLKFFTLFYTFYSFVWEIRFRLFILQVQSIRKILNGQKVTLTLLRQIISADVLCQYSWSITCNQAALKNLKLFNDILFGNAAENYRLLFW